MNNLISLRIFTPNGIIFNSLAFMVVIPGIDGDIGVLNRHSSMITQLRQGIIYVFREEKKITARYYIDSGIAHITFESLIVLSESTESVDKLDIGIINAKLPLLKDIELSKAEAQLNILKNLTYG